MAHGPARSTTRAIVTGAFSLHFVLGCWVYFVGIVQTRVRSKVWLTLLSRMWARAGEGRAGGSSTRVVPCSLLFTHCSALCNTNTSFGNSG